MNRPVLVLATLVFLAAAVAGPADTARSDPDPIEAAGFSFDGESDALRNPGDDRTMSVFDDRIRRSTNRFVYRFVKPQSVE